jgi:hypothetical protein
MPYKYMYVRTYISWVQRNIGKVWSIMNTVVQAMKVDSNVVGQLEKCAYKAEIRNHHTSLSSWPITDVSQYNEKACYRHIGVCYWHIGVCYWHI